MIKNISIICLIITTSLCYATNLTSFVDSLKPGVWKEIPNSKIPLFTWEEVDQYAPGANGVSGSRSVLEAFNGAALDEKRLKWYFYGGGHSAYGGNEVYQFDLKNFIWTRLTTPSPLDGEFSYDSNGDGKLNQCREPKKDSGPPAVHTYDAFTVDPKTGYLHLMSGLTFCNPSGALRNLWVFKPIERVWAYYDPIPGGPVGGQSDYDPKTGDILVSKYGYFSRYHPAKNTFTYLGDIPETRYSVNASYDYHNNIFVTFDCKGHILHVNPDTGKLIRVVPVVLSDLIPKCSIAMGFEYHPKLKKMVVWPEEREVYIFDHITGEVNIYQNLEGPAPSRKYGSVYDKWAYLDKYDVFIAYSNTKSGVWMWKMPENKPKLPKKYGNLARYMNKNIGGKVPEGEYNRGALIKANNAIYDMTNVVSNAGMIQSKAYIINAGNNNELFGWECANARVGDGNGACVRNETGKLVLNKVNFHDNQEGVLGGGDLFIKDSLFTRNGHAGRAHQIYFFGDTLNVKNTKFMAAVGEGHGIKTGARVTILDGVTIDGTGGKMSRNVDAYNGGELIIRNSLFIKADSDTNSGIIGYDYEHRKTHPVSKIILENNTFICGKKASVLRGAHSFDDVEIISKGNIYKGNCSDLPP